MKAKHNENLKKIIASLKDDETEYVASAKLVNYNPLKILVIVSGPPGTGKALAIHYARHYLESQGFPTKNTIQG